MQAADVRRTLFVGLKAHSHYSFWRGVASPGRLADAAKEWGAGVVALADLNLLAGVPEFVDRCREIGIRSVVGCEFRGIGGARLTLMARTAEGYRNLLGVSTLVSSGRPVGPELLQGRATGLVGVLRPSLLGTVVGMMDLRDLFDPECLLLELPFNAAREYLELVRERTGPGLGVAATADFWLTQDSDTVLADLVCRAAARGKSGWGRGKSGWGRGFEGEGLSCRGPFSSSGGLPSLEVIRKHPAVDEEVWQKACGAAREIWTACADGSIGPGASMDGSGTRKDGLGAGNVLPSFRSPAGFDEASYLRRVALEGARQRGVGGSQALSRLERELGLVTSRGLAGYFLILWDLVGYARREGIPVGPGRGSAVGSLLAYSLGITEVNPLDHGLLFERFLNEERLDLPDIDLDLGHIGRYQVIDYLIRTHGRDRVVHQGVVTRLGARGAVRAAGRALGTDPRIVDRAAKLIPRTRGQGGLAESLRSAPEVRGLPLNDAGVRSLIRAAMLMEGLPTGFATHASALIISPGPAVEHLPLALGFGGQFLTQYEPDSVTALGCPKFDLLGLRNLTLVRDTLVSVGQDPNSEKIPRDDPKTWEMIGRGETIGCFQLDSPGMREVLRAIRPRNLAELTACISLYRPGPWDPATLRAYVGRKEGRESIPPVHPLADPVLKETHGVLLYQEQVMELAHSVAGFSFGEADQLRRDLAARRGESWREIFTVKARARGLSAETAARVYDLLRRFSGYSFNKAHVTAYALTSYRTAYLKAHFPEIYFPLLVRRDSGYFSADVYRLEAGRCGVQLDEGPVARQLTFFDGPEVDILAKEEMAILTKEKKPKDPAANHPDCALARPSIRTAIGDSLIVKGPVASCRRQEDRRGRPMLELLIRQGRELITVIVPSAVYARDVMELDPAGIAVEAYRPAKVGSAQASRRDNVAREPGGSGRLIARQIRALAR